MKSITELYSEHLALERELNRLDQQALSHGVKNEQEQAAVVCELDALVFKILTTQPNNESEKQIFINIWAGNADVIVQAEEGDIFHNLHLKLSVLSM